MSDLFPNRASLPEFCTLMWKQWKEHMYANLMRATQCLMMCLVFGKVTSIMDVIQCRFKREAATFTYQDTISSLAYYVDDAWWFSQTVMCIVLLSCFRYTLMGNMWKEVEHIWSMDAVLVHSSCMFCACPIYTFLIKLGEEWALRNFWSKVLY